MRARDRTPSFWILLFMFCPGGPQLRDNLSPRRAVAVGCVAALDVGAVIVADGGVRRGPGRAARAGRIQGGGTVRRVGDVGRVEAVDRHGRLPMPAPNFGYFSSGVTAAARAWFEQLRCSLSAPLFARNHHDWCSSVYAARLESASNRSMHYSSYCDRPDTLRISDDWCGSTNRMRTTGRESGPKAASSMRHQPPSTKHRADSLLLPSTERPLLPLTAPTTKRRHPTRPTGRRTMPGSYMPMLIRYVHLDRHQRPTRLSSRRPWRGSMAPALK